MKSTLSAAFFAASLLAAMPSTALGQGTFRNLDFENGTFIPVPGDPLGRVQWAPALPGWKGYLGSNQQSVVSLNSLSLSAANIAIMGPDYPVPGLFHGQFYVVLQNSFPVSTDVPMISQSGTIPVGSQSIQIWTHDRFAIGVRVFFADQEVRLSQLGTTTTGQWVWGGDVSGFAGQLGELRFRGAGYLDNIQFSDQPVPEPGVFGLSALGALLLGWRVLRRRR